MNVLQTALEAIETLLTDNTSEAAQAAAADARIKLMNAMMVEPVLYIDADTLAMDNAHVGAWKPGHELAGNLPLYLHPPQPYDQQAMELCSECGWKAIMPGEPCFVCNMNLDAQQAKQVPMTNEEVLTLVPGLVDCLCDPYDKQISGDDYSSVPIDMLRLARAIEAHHGIGGEA